MGQRCAVFSVNAPGQMPVFLRLQAPRSQCSDVSYTVTRPSGALIQTIFLAPNSSQPINLGRLASGQHWFLISATGRPGGCITGSQSR